MAGPNSGFLGAAAPGLGAMAQAIADGGRTYQMQMLGLQSKLAQEMAAAQAAQAKAGLEQAQAGKVGSEQRVIDNRPALFEEQVANAAGTDSPMVRAIRQTMTTGQAPQVPMGPPTESGQMDVGSQQFDPAIKSRVGLAIQQYMPLLANSGDVNPEQFAKGADTWRDMNMSDRILGGGLNRNAVAGAQAATKGNDMFTPNEWGSTDKFTGGVQPTAPGQRYGDWRVASTQKERAQAAEAGAGVGLKGAQAEEARAGAQLKTAEATQYTSGDIDTTARAIANGQIPPPSGMALMNPKNQRILARVMEINPEYDYTTVTAKKAAATGFTTGQQGNALRSVSTANAHLDQLGQMADAMNNKDIPVVNRGINWFKRELGNDPAVTNFDAVKNVVGQEVVKAIVAGGGSAGERDEATAAFSNAKTPAQIKGVIEHYRAVMGAQADNLLEQRRAAGLSDKTLPNYKTKVAAPAASSAPGAPAHVASDADYNALPSGSTFIGPDGKTRRKP